VSLHADGTVILYPMEATNRRAERRRDVLAALEAQAFRISRVVDLSHMEREGRHLEGTGSLILDHAARVADAALSSRTDALAVAEFARVTGLEALTFPTRDEAGRALYHANVMLTIGTAFAVVCPDVIADPHARSAVLARLEASGREIIAITPAMVRGFAANILELRGAGGQAVIAMSARARAALGPALTGRLERHGSIVAVPIPVIERVGGGSVRCMHAENFLPR
jgi:hypothetical protein